MPAHEWTIHDAISLLLWNAFAKSVRERDSF